MSFELQTPAMNPSKSNIDLLVEKERVEKERPGQCSQHEPRARVIDTQLLTPAPYGLYIQIFLSDRTRETRASLFIV